MMFLNSLSKRQWQSEQDLIQTFSDSDDIPDLDAEAEDAEVEDGRLGIPEANTGRKRKELDTDSAIYDSSKGSKKNKKRRKQEPGSDEESEEGGWADKSEDDGNFNPAFTFDDSGASGELEEGFSALAVPGISQSKRVDATEIARRRRAQEPEDASENDDLEEAVRDDSEEPDDERGLDEAEDDDEDYDDDDDDSVAAPMPHPDDLDVPDRSDAEGADSDTNAEELLKQKAFFAAPDPVPTTKTQASFQNLQLSRPLLKGLTALGFAKPTPIQAKTIPMALLGKDVVGGAVTGSGKTAAFVLPILERLLYRPNKLPTTRVTILTPTRELAVQCHAVATKLAQFTDITFALIVGGLSLREQEATLKRRPDIVIATPGRFIDHMRNTASFAVDRIEILVLDEADRMLEDGFADELNELLKTIPRSRQTMLFSATMTTGVDDLIRAGLDKPVRLVVDAQKSTVPKLVQEFIKIKGDKMDTEEREYRRQACLLHMCARVYTSRAIIFVPTKQLAHRLQVLFALRGVNSAELHGSMSQEERLNAIAAFRDGRATHLLATDLASRGLDIPRVETVINYTVPTSSTTYLHRVGRTARAGRAGVSVTIFENSKAKASSGKGSKGQKGPTSERTLLRPILKMAKSQKAPMRTRALPPDSINDLTLKIQSLQPEIDDILKEEKEERLLQQTERDMTKSENMLKHEDEIKSRPRRTWFQTETEKEAAKKRGAEGRMGQVGEGGVASLGEPEKKSKKVKKRLSGKEKKKLDARKERMAGRHGKHKQKGKRN